MWQSKSQVDEGLSRLPLTEQKKALEAQLKFRTEVCGETNKSFLEEKHAGKYTKLADEELKQNLINLIEDTRQHITTEDNQEGIPLLVSKIIDHRFENYWLVVLGLPAL